MTSKIDSRRRLLAEFADSTSTPGFNSFHRSQLCWRLIWVVVLSAAWAFCAFQSIQLIINYLQYESKVSVKIEVFYMFLPLKCRKNNIEFDNYYNNFNFNVIRLK